MDLQTKPIAKLRMARVKDIATDEEMEEIYVGLYSGEIRVYISETMQIARSQKVMDSSIRALSIISEKDLILAGGDDGYIYVLNTHSLSLIEKIKAHDDFIRRIIVNKKEGMFITTSDDRRTKLWNYRNGITMVRKYKDAQHFVMDACFCPNDSRKFITVSLDSKIHIYSIDSASCIKKYKGHSKGINTIEFIDDNFFATGSDDATIIVWDYNRGTILTRLDGHANSVNKIYKVKDGFISCSSDSTARIWNRDMSCRDVLYMSGRVWCFSRKPGIAFFGTDEELIGFSERSRGEEFLVTSSKLFYTEGKVLKTSKLPEDTQAKGSVLELPGIKELSNGINENIKNISASPNGKYISLHESNQFTVYSSLGFRRKYEYAGDNMLFLTNELFVFRKNSTISIVDVSNSNIPLICTGEYPGLNSIVGGNGKILFANTTKKTVTISLNEIMVGEGDSLGSIYEFPFLAKKTIILEKNIVLLWKKISIYTDNFEFVCEIDFSADFYAYDYILLTNNAINEKVKYPFFIFGNKSKTIYGFIVEKTFYNYGMEYIPFIAGLHREHIYYIENIPKFKTLNFEFIKFQISVLIGAEPNATSLIRNDAIEFYVSLGRYEEALKICIDQSYKFEIYLRIGRFNDAYNIADTSEKLKKVGEMFFINEEFQKSSECFRKAKSTTNLLLSDIFGEKKHLEHIAKSALQKNALNIAFMALYKSGNYRKCAELLKETPFYKIFVENHISE